MKALLDYVSTVTDIRQEKKVLSGTETGGRKNK